MGVIQRDLEARISDRTEELARERYQTEFEYLSPHLQMELWIEAEHLEQDRMASQMDAAYDAMRETGMNHWDELELERRLGK